MRITKNLIIAIALLIGGLVFLIINHSETSNQPIVINNSFEPLPHVDLYFNLDNPSQILYRENYSAPFKEVNK